MTQSKLDYRTCVAALSLVVGPLLMSVGDLIHPAERLDAAEQAAIIVENASRWYAAHLLLFLGLLAFVPGFLALTSLTAERSAWAGFAAKRLLLMGVASFCAVFVAEMLVGRYVSDGAGVSAATELLTTFQSGWIVGAVLVGGIAFYLGLALFAIPLITAGGPLRWPAIAFLVGGLFILVEIISAEVLFSQIGNIVMFGAGVASAWHIVRDRRVVST